MSLYHIVRQSDYQSQVRTPTDFRWFPVNLKAQIKIISFFSFRRPAGQRHKSLT